MKSLLLSFMMLYLASASYAIGPVTGPSSVCQGSTITLSDTTAGGTWSSSNTAIATVGSTGTVSGVASGTATISYTIGGSYSTLTITVNPIPALSSSLTPPAICNSQIFNYVPMSATAGTAFAWYRAAVPGIFVPAGAGFGTINEVLLDTMPFPVPVAYTYTLTASGCTHVQTITVTVNPTPLLSSWLTPPAICDSQIFNYVPMSAIAGTTFAWSRASVPGIVEPADTGSGTINEALLDTTPLPVPVAYTYTLTANGCTHVQTITVTVNPTPLLTSPLSFPPMCDTQAFIYVPTSSTPGATFTWSRPGVSGVLPATSFGFGNIHEFLTDTRGIPDTITYYFRLGINGCANLFAQSVTVIIDTDCSSAGITSISGNGGINVYPNPSRGIITVSGFNRGSSMELYNALGIKILTQKACMQNEHKIDITPFPAGMYYIVVRNDKGTFTSKIIKQ